MYSYISGLRKIADTINKNRKLLQLQADRLQRHRALGQYADPYADDHFVQNGSFLDTARARQHAQHLNTKFKPIWEEYNDKYIKLQQEHARRKDRGKPGVTATYLHNVKLLYRKYQKLLQRYHRQYDHSGYFQSAVDRHIDLSGQYNKLQLTKIQQVMRNRYPLRSFNVRLQLYKDNSGKPVYMPTVSLGTPGAPGYHSYGYASWKPQLGQPDRVYLIKPRRRSRSVTVYRMGTM